MRSQKKRIAALILGTAITFLSFTGAASASRADGVCGGIGTWDPVTGQCV